MYSTCTKEFKGLDFVLRLMISTVTQGLVDLDGYACTRGVFKRSHNGVYTVAPWFVLCCRE